MLPVLIALNIVSNIGDGQDAVEVESTVEADNQGSEKEPEVLHVVNEASPAEMDEPDNKGHVQSRSIKGSVPPVEADTGTASTTSAPEKETGSWRNGMAEAKSSRASRTAETNVEQKETGRYISP
jgi:hypothetical protein